MNIAIDVEDLDRVVARIRRLTDPSFVPDMLDAVGAVIVQQTQRRFQETKTDPDGAAWAGWRPSTGGGKGKGDGILVDTGRLMGSIQAIVGGSEVVVGTNTFYATFHQFGTRKMVARAFLGIGADDRDKIEQVVMGYIKEWIGS